MGPLPGQRTEAPARAEVGARSPRPWIALALSLAVHAGLALLAVRAGPVSPVRESSAPIRLVRVVAERSEAAAPEAEPLAPAPPAPAPAAPARRVRRERPPPSASAAAARRPAREAEPAPPARAPVPAPAPVAAAPPAPPGAAAGPAAAAAELRLRSRRPPRYPQGARLRGVEGVTLLRVRVEGSGRVGEVHVERSAGDAELDRAARDAVRAWRFEPLERLRSAAGLWVLVPVEFRLR